MAVKLIKSRHNHYGATHELDPSALEPGDTVAWVHRRSGYWAGSSATLFTVSRRTKTQIICTNTSNGMEQRFREDGSPMGGGHYRTLQAPFDPEVLDAIESRRMEEWQDTQKKLIKDAKAGDHDTRMSLLAEVAGLAAKVQNDLLDVRSAISEWHAAVHDAR
jgi:hypothetical protein